MKLFYSLKIINSKFNNMSVMNTQQSPTHGEVKQSIELPPSILQGLENMMLTMPSEFQTQTLPIILAHGPSKQNVLAVAPRRSGKTVTSWLGVLAQVDEEQCTPQAIYICQSVSLEYNIWQMRTICRFTNIKIRILHESEIDKVDAQVIVGTPDSILQLMRRELFDLRHINVFSIDECQDEDFQEKCMEIKKLLPNTTQTLLFAQARTSQVARFATKLLGDDFASVVEKHKITIISK